VYCGQQAAKIVEGNLLFALAWINRTSEKAGKLGPDEEINLVHKNKAKRQLC